MRNQAIIDALRDPTIPAEVVADMLEEIGLDKVAGRIRSPKGPPGMESLVEPPNLRQRYSDWMESTETIPKWEGDVEGVWPHLDQIYAYHGMKFSKA